MKKTLFLWLITLSATISGFSQVTTANMAGYVNDSNNQPLTGANVVALHTPTGSKYGAVTNEDGKFTILNMRVGGPYTIKVSYVGYQDAATEGIMLDLGKTEQVSIVLTSNDNQLKEVVVTGTSSGVFSGNKTGAVTSVGKRELTQLPTISRSAADFTRLDPSSSNGSFAGRNDQFNNYTLNGAIFNNPFGLDAATPGGQTDAQPISLDAIEQISVATAPYDVTMAGFTGASINAVTKSGTNKITGTAYSFYRNQDFTGDKIKNESIFVPKLEQVQSGFSIGLPIVKNKLFVFGNFEIDNRSDLGSSYIANNGDATTSINESRVLLSDLLAVQSGLRNIGYDPGSFEGFSHLSESKKGIIKLDWNINDNHKLAFIYNFLDASKEKPAHPTAIFRRGPDANTLQFEKSGYKINNILNSFLIELNSKFSDNISNKFQAGYTLFDDSRNPFSTPAPVITITKNGSPYIIAGHEPFSIHNTLDQKVFQITNNLNYILGKNTFTIGGSFEKFQFKNSFNLKGYGFDVFGSVDINNFAANLPYYQTALLNAQNTYNTKNQIEPGTNGGWNLAEINVGQLSFYAQDEISITNNIKVTAGIRIDKPMYFDTSEMAQKFIDTDNSEGYLPNITYYNPNTLAEVKFDSTKMPSDAILFSPRIGFNIDVKGDKTAQVRGGSGLFTGKFPFVWIGNQVSGIDPFFYQVVDNDFKFPQVWRTSLGFDQKFKNNLILSVDMSYNKDINGVHVQNWGLKKPTQTVADGSNRPYYGNVVPDGTNDYGIWTDYGFPVRSNAYVLTNTDKGSAFNTSIKIQKTFENGLYTSFAYNYLDSKDVNSIEAEITGDAFAFNPAKGNVNDATLSNSKYGDKHRFIGVASKKWNYGNGKWSTTLSTFFEYAQGGRFSYTYGGDINNDGAGGNDLLYVPTKAQIATMNFANPAQAQAFDNYIDQDDYLKEMRGRFTDRYGALAPWRNRWDLKLLQDYNFNVGSGKTNTIQFSIDVLNLGNLLNSDWGLVQVPTSVQPVGVSVNPNTKVPTFTFNGNQKTFNYDTSLNSRWQAQFGIRYIF